MAALGDITQLLAQMSAGDEHALDKLMPLVYRHLRTVAGRTLRREPGDLTLDTTSLVHEAYLRLVDQTRAHWQERAQFYAIASRIMRRILLDHARKRRSMKRGRGRARVALDNLDLAMRSRPLDLEALDEALQRLAALDPQLSRLVELRFFGGRTIEETAEVLGVSPATVKREWIVAKAWLRSRLGGGPDASEVR